MENRKRSFKVFAVIMAMMLMTGVLARCGDKNADKKDSASKAKVVKVGGKSIVSLLLRPGQPVFLRHHEGVGEG